MKRILIVLMLFAGLAFSQRVITSPRTTNWYTILNSTIASADTTDGYSIKNAYGNTTLWFKIGTVDSIKSDVTVKLQLYNSKSSGWGEYQDSPTIFTISSSMITANNEFYYKLTDYDAWAWADVVRFIISVTSTSSFQMTVYIGGQ